MRPPCGTPETFGAPRSRILPPSPTKKNSGSASLVISGGPRGNAPFVRGFDDTLRSLSRGGSCCSGGRVTDWWRDLFSVRGSGPDTQIRVQEMCSASGARNGNSEISDIREGPWLFRRDPDRFIPSSSLPMSRDPTHIQRWRKRVHNR